MDPVIAIWCIYDFHKRGDHDVTKNLNAIKPYREMSVSVKDKVEFLFCKKSLLSQHILPY